MTAKISTASESKTRVDSDLILDVVSVYCSFNSMIMHTEHEEMFVYRQSSGIIEKWNDKENTFKSFIGDVISVYVR